MKIKYPYCPQCGALFPAGEGITHCKLCYERYLLVLLEENRRKRYRSGGLEKGARHTGR